MITPGRGNSRPRAPPRPFAAPCAMPPPALRTSPRYACPSRAERLHVESRERVVREARSRRPPGGKASSRSRVSTPEAGSRARAHRAGSATVSGFEDSYPTQSKRGPSGDEGDDLPAPVGDPMDSTVGIRENGDTAIAASRRGVVRDREDSERLGGQIEIVPVPDRERSDHAGSRFRATIRKSPRSFGRSGRKSTRNSEPRPAPARRSAGKSTRACPRTRRDGFLQNPPVAIAVRHVGQTNCREIDLMAVRIGGLVELTRGDLDAADVPELMNRAPTVRLARGRTGAGVVLHLRDRIPGEAKHKTTATRPARRRSAVSVRRFPREICSSSSRRPTRSPCSARCSRCRSRPTVLQPRQRSWSRARTRSIRFRRSHWACRPTNTGDVEPMLHVPPCRVYVPPARAGKPLFWPYKIW